MLIDRLCSPLGCCNSILLMNCVSCHLAGYCTTVQGSGSYSGQDDLLVDTEGSGCSCEAGYVLDDSGTSCLGENYTLSKEDSTCFRGKHNLLINNC